MQLTKLYPKLILLVSFLVLGFVSVSAQTLALETKLQLIDDNTWGVYVRPTNAISPTSNTITGSAQVTVVMPLGFVYTALTSVSGAWTDASGVVPGPAENPTRTYVSFGLVQDVPKIIYTTGAETLLFTFDRVSPCPDSIWLIDCNSISGVSDPFCPDIVDATPGTNSEGTNPGNEFSVIDFGNFGSIYYYADNYAFSAWNCHDCDSDGILNALEDTNGNGVFDPGIDTSALCDPCDPIHVETATLEFVDSLAEMCAADLTDSACFVVNIVGGWSPYTVIYSDGTQTDTVTNYISGDTICLNISASSNITLTNVIDSFLCEIDPDSMFGTLPVIVHGPLSFTDHPDNVTECSTFGTYFEADGVNAGGGIMSYQWQISTNNGVSFFDLNENSPYDNVTSDSLIITSVAGLDTRQYRVKIWTPLCDTVYSNAALLRVEGPITASTHPIDRLICAGAATTYTGAGTNSGLVGTFTYQWQLSTNGGTTWADQPNGGVYSGMTTPTMTITGATQSMDGYDYRLAISTLECNRVFTNPANLDIDGPLSISNHPDNISNCAGSEVFFNFEYLSPGSAIGNDDVTYQWQVNDGTGWVNLVDGAVYNGTNGILSGVTGGDTLAITNVVGLNGYQYRVSVRTGVCNLVFSNAATLDVSGAVSFNNAQGPNDITVCAGSDTIFVACASIPQGTFTFGWEFSTDAGVTWAAVTMAGIYSHSTPGVVSTACDTLRISNVNGLIGYRYRSVAFATDCDSIISEEARLLVEGPLSVLDHPNYDTICSGSPVSFSADINNLGDPASILQYQWQIAFDTTNNSWINLSNSLIYNGVSTPTLLISSSAGLHNAYFRLRTGTSTCNDIFTNAARLIVEGPITVTDHPDAVTLCSGGSTSFTSTGNVGTAGTLFYQWQVSSDNGVNWSNLSNGGAPGYSGVTTTTLSIADVTGLYSRCYRLRFTTGQCSGASAVFSQRACLTVEGPISFTNHPDDVTECSGDPVLFIVGTQNTSTDVTGFGSVLYQWQESTNGGTTWTDITDDLVYGGSNTDTMLITTIAGKDNNEYRCIIRTPNCARDTSNAATLSVEGPISVLDEPDNITECAGSSVTFQATFSNPGLGTVLYQWEYSTNGGTSWVNLANGGAMNISGANTPTLIVANTIGLPGLGTDDGRFRLEYWTATCDTAYTNYAVLTVEGPISITDQPDVVNACSGEVVNFGVSTSNTGAGAISYQWQIKPLAGSWTNLGNNSVFNGVTSSNLSVLTAGLNGACFRTLIETSTCSSISSDSACLVVEGPIAFTDHPDDITQCSAESVQFCGTSAIAIGGSGTMTYQWQVSSDNGVNWSNVSNGGVPGYVGATTTCLNITNVAGLNGRRYRLAARTTECNPVNSNFATLSVEGPLTVTANPADYTNCSDEQAFFYAQVTNPGVGAEQFQWQVSTNGGTSWANINNLPPYSGANSDTLGIAPIAGLDNYRYRMRAWTGTCDTVTTTSATLGVEGPLSITDEPDDVTLCSTSPVCFTIAVVNPGLGTVTYQWQRSTNGGVSWTNVVNSAPYSGAFTNQLCISNSAGLGNYKFRCQVRTPNCEPIFSIVANLFVEGPITISLQPVDATVCSNIGHTFTTTVTNPGSGAMTFQWQRRPPAGTWANIAATNSAPTGFGATYTGIKTEDLSINAFVDGLNGYMYRLIIRTSTCADTTNEVTLTVQDACLTGTCDFDLDGLANDPDPDMDNDQLADLWEDWITLHNTLDGWNYTDNLGNPLNMSNCDVDSDNDGLLDNQEDPDGDNISNGEETDGDLIFDGNPLDPCDPVLGPTCIGINLAIKVWLQGPKIGNPPADSLLMRDDLRKKGLIPLQEPYENMTTFAHATGGDGGGEEILQADSLTILGVTGPNAIVDWVFVELRPSTNLDSIATTRSGLLQRDGDIVDVNGDSVLHFPTANAGSFYVVVRHRNHLGVMTAEALDLSPIVQEVDFTDDSFLTNGVYAQVNLNGRMALWAGDLDSNGRSIYQGPGNDVQNLFYAVLYDNGNADFIANYISPGYKTSDINLDGRSIYQGPANDRAMLLFNVILTYPVNQSHLANYVVLEQLP